MKNNDYFENLKFSYYFLNFAGVFPFDLKRRENVLAKILSIVVCTASMLLFSCMWLMDSFYLIQYIRNVIYQSDFKFSQFALVMPSVLTRSYIILIPFHSWKKKRNILEHLNNWLQFQNEFKNITGSKPIKFEGHLKMLYSVTFAAWTFLICGTAFALGKLNVDYRSLTMLHIAMTLNFIILYWHNNAFVTKCAAEALIKEVQRSITETDSTKCKKIISLWLNLCSLVENYNKFHSFMFLSHFSICVMTSIFGLYANMLYFIVNIKKPVYYVTFAIALFSVFCMYEYCEEAHIIYKKMASDSQKVLLNINMMNLNPLLLNEIWTFLQVIDTNKPKIVLGGFLTLDRSLMCAVLSFCVNNLITLRQFSLSTREQ